METEMKNVWCFKLLSFELICYVTIGDKYAWRSKQWLKQDLIRNQALILLSLSFFTHFPVGMLVTLLYTKNGNLVSVILFDSGFFHQLFVFILVMFFDTQM